jgi:hypothetical protein
MHYASAQISIPLGCHKDRLSTKPSELGFRESTFRHITQVLRDNRLGIVSLFPALPACYFPLPLSIPGWLVNLEMFLLISPDHFGDAVVTVTAHASGDMRVQHEFRLIADSIKDGFFRILGAAAWAKSIAVRFKAGFPFWFQCQLDEALMCPICHDWNP